MTVLLFFFAFAFTLYTSTVYADHCTPEQEAAGISGSYTGELAEYCSAGIQRYQDLNNCRHRFIQNCPTGTQCVEENTPGVPFFTRCVPGAAPTGTSADKPAGLEQIEAIFTNVIKVVVGLGFIVLLIMLIMAGFKYLTSGGEPKAVASAHQTVTWALLGILFMAIAWLVLQLIHAFTGVDVTIFNIKDALPQ